MKNLANTISGFFSSKSDENTISETIKYLDKVKIEMKSKGIQYRESNGHWDGKQGRQIYIFESKIEVLLQNDPIIHQNYLLDLFESCSEPRAKKIMLNCLLIIYGQKIVPYIFSEKGQIQMDYWESDSYYQTLFKLLQTVDYQPYEAKVWEFAKHKSKKIRELTAVTLSKLGERILPEVEKMLNDKKAETRQTAALILSLMKSDKAQLVLVNAIDTEKNDDARDTMLEGVSGLLYSEISKEIILQKIQKAKERNKLEKPLEWWLDETKLPAINWKDSSEVIDNEGIRFLFYRMSRAKDIRTDLEAKPFILLIDRAKSGAFAKALLKTYFDNGADAKYKFCLTLGGLLGDNDIIELLRKKVVEFAEGSRGKMAEYIVKALALQGSTKALRAVEFFSRKYKNKNKNIGAAANDSFAIAAEELGITPYDLADSIIPDFGFEGLFREFEAGGEAYRAFINTDFKISFFNEDNKISKSPPKAISKELAEEFKEIGKEIKDIVKSQSSRLEQYLVIQRKWSAEKWQAFFMGNPIMFAYTVRLVWGMYDAQNQLINTFMCQQDQTLVNQSGDEMELSEDVQIGIVHPISLNPESIDYWITCLYDANLEPIFPQLKRPVVSLKTENQDLKISTEFKGTKLSGYTFVSKLDKLGWYRGSVQDGGWIASFYKDFVELGITAIVLQQGNICIGYLEVDAEIGDIMFVKKGNVYFGSYSYDEPQKVDDPRLIAFRDVPEIVYSEVMADMQAIKAIKKE